MNFKCALILAAVAFCAVQAASVDNHERNRRQAADMLSKAKTFVTDMKNKFTNGLRNTLDRISGSLKDVEETVINVVTKALGPLNVDVRGLVNTLKGNIKSCAVSADIKAKAAAVKSDLLACVAAEIKTVETIIKDVTDFINEAKGVPAVVSNAVAVCKGKDGESFSVTRLAECMEAIKKITAEESLFELPEAILKQIEQAKTIAESIKNNGAACVVDKVKTAGSTIKDVAKSVASCVVAG